MLSFFLENAFLMKRLKKIIILSEHLHYTNQNFYNRVIINFQGFCSGKIKGTDASGAL